MQLSVSSYLIKRIQGIRVKKLLVLPVLAYLFTGQVVYGAVCDHTPSKLIGAKTTAAVEGAATATVVTGVGMKAAGLYTITHATTGAAMLGSTAAGASAAGTTGIIAGSAGFIGTAGAVLLSPFVLIPAAVITVGIGFYEGGCYMATRSDEDQPAEEE